MGRSFSFLVEYLVTFSRLVFLFVSPKTKTRETRKSIGGKKPEIFPESRILTEIEQSQKRLVSFPVTGIKMSKVEKYQTEKETKIQKNTEN